MTKISQQEFANYADEFSRLFDNFNAELKGDEQEMSKKLAKLAVAYIRAENPLILARMVEVFHDWGQKTGANAYANEPIPRFGNLSFKQWLEKIEKRLKEHYIAKGKYKPGKRRSFDSTKQKFNWYYENFLEDNDKFTAISPYLDKETYQDLSNAREFSKEAKKIFDEYNVPENDDDDEEIEKIFCKKYYFIVDDLHANFQEAERKKAERERERESYSPAGNENSTNTPQSSSSQPSQNNPASGSPFNNSLNAEAQAEITKLQREKDQAEARVRELQDRLINNAALSPDKIKDYENQLATALKEVRDKAWQIQQMQIGAKSEIPGTKQSPTSSPSSLDWKWAVGIGLGAIIAILLLILVVVNISRKREK